MKSLPGFYSRGSFSTVGGNLGLFGGRFCRWGCRGAFAACAVGCSGVSGGFGTVACLSVCSILLDECLNGC